MTSPTREAAFFHAQAPSLVDTGTARIAYRRYGAGEPLILIHGWPFSGFIYRKLLPRLAERYTCFVIDLPGAGRSEWDTNNDFSFHGHAEHLQRFRQAVGIERYRLLAHDTGATVARRLAILDGDRVGQLVLIDTEIPMHRPPLVPFVQKLFALPGSGAVFSRLLRSRRYLRSAAGFGGCFVDLSLIEGEFHDEFIAPLIDSPRVREGQIRYALGIDWAQLDGLAQGHREIRGEVLLLWGEQDPFFPIERARGMVDDFPRCRGLVAIPGCKLLPHEERPDVVLQHTLAFFGE